MLVILGKQHYVVTPFLWLLFLCGDVIGDGFKDVHVDIDVVVDIGCYICINTDTHMWSKGHYVIYDCLTFQSCKHLPFHRKDKCMWKRFWGIIE